MTGPSQRRPTARPGSAVCPTVVPGPYPPSFCSPASRNVSGAPVPRSNAWAAARRAFARARSVSISSDARIPSPRRIRPIQLIHDLGEFTARLRHPDPCGRGSHADSSAIVVHLLDDSRSRSAGRSAMASPSPSASCAAPRSPRAPRCARSPPYRAPVLDTDTLVEASLDAHARTSRTACAERQSTSTPIPVPRR